MRAALARRTPGLVATAAWAALFCLLVFRMGALGPLFAALFPGVEDPVYRRAGFPTLVAEHAVMVLVASGLAALAGIAVGIAVTRRSGRDFLAAADGLAALGQTIPPVAVLALAVPVVGFGAWPTIIALFLYGLLPVLRNTIAGLGSVPAPVLDAAIGMGLTDAQTLARIELRLAWPVILAGVRTSTVINVGTAAIGATIGAGGLGAPIIAGITANNPAWVLEGALAAGLFAILVDRLLGLAEGMFRPG